MLRVLVFHCYETQSKQGKNITRKIVYVFCFLPQFSQLPNRSKLVSFELIPVRVIKRLKNDNDKNECLWIWRNAKWWNRAVGNPPPLQVVDLSIYDSRLHLHYFPANFFVPNYKIPTHRCSIDVTKSKNTLEQHTSLLSLAHRHRVYKFDSQPHHHHNQHRHQNHQLYFLLPKILLILIIQCRWRTVHWFSLKYIEEESNKDEGEEVWGKGRESVE